ncbi:MAG: WS/DGAT domain-containing protein [Gemmataceae bacterium]
MRLRFDLPPDYAAIAAAARLVASRHPRLAGRVEGIDAARPAEAKWVPSSADMMCEAAELPDRPRPVDLKRGPGLRATWRDRELLFEFHHACIDGLGVVHFLSELFAELRSSANPEPAGVQVKDNRGTACAPTLRTGSVLHRLSFALRRVATFYRHRPRPLAVIAPSRRGGPAWHSGTLSTDVTNALRAVARRLEVTVNDLLIRDLFLALAAWNAAANQPGGNIRLAVPMSTRDGTSQDIANSVSMVFLDRRTRRHDSDNLLRSIAAEMSLVRRERLEAALLRALNLLGRVPGAIRRVYGSPRCHSTSVISNVGVLFDGRAVRIGDSALCDVTFLAPVRPLTRVAFVAVTYAGQLSIGVTIDPTELSGKDGQSLLASFIDRLRETSAVTMP